MLRALKEKSGPHARKDGQYKQWEENQESKGNARNRKHSNRYEECLYGLIGRLDTAEERISEFEYVSLDTSQTK